VGAKDQKHMAALIGATPTAWNNVMRGRDLSKDLAIKIHTRWREISLEWLLLGETNLLTGDTVRRLEEAEQRVAKKKVKLEPYDAAEFLDTAELVTAYLGEALRSGDQRRIDLALGAIQRASGRFTKHPVSGRVHVR
jgi:hypothetical protein